MEPKVRIDMRGACDHHHHMPVMVQIRNVPDALHRRLKSLAALAGQTLSDYLLAEIRDAADRPTMEEMSLRLAEREPVALSDDPVRILREERNSR